MDRLNEMVRALGDSPKASEPLPSNVPKSGLNLSPQDQFAIAQWVSDWTRISIDAKFTEMRGGRGGSIPNFYYFYQQKLGISNPPDPYSLK